MNPRKIFIFIFLNMYVQFFFFFFFFQSEILIFSLSWKCGMIMHLGRIAAVIISVRGAVLCRY